MLPTIKCDMTNILTSVTFSLLTSVLFIKSGQVSCNFKEIFDNVLLQDTVNQENLYHITRYSYVKKSTLLQDTITNFSI